LISAIYAWVGLVFGSSFVRINLHYFAIYTHISPITLGFGLFGFWLQIYTYRAKYWEKIDKLRPNQVMRSSRNKPNRPKTADPRQNLRPRRCSKNALEQGSETALARGHHGYSVVAAFPGLFRFLHGFSFSHVIFSRFVLLFCL